MKPTASIPYDMMSRRIFTTLVLFCGLTLVLPPGWCCVMVAAPCCQGKKHREPARETPVCPHCQSETPSAPGDDAPVKPKRGPVCCCDKELPTLASRTTPTPQAVAIVTAVEETAAAPSPLSSSTLWLAVHSGLPPLHILHCLWLC